MIFYKMLNMQHKHTLIIMEIFPKFNSIFFRSTTFTVYNILLSIYIFYNFTVMNFQNSIIKFYVILHVHYRDDSWFIFFIKFIYCFLY